MGEIIAAAVILVVVVVGLAFGLPLALQALKRQRELERAPAPAVLDHGSPADQQRVLTYYRLLQRSCRQLERVLQEDEVLPHLRVEERREIEDTLQQFDNL